MNNIVVFKTTQHMNDGIRFTDICQKLVAQSFTFTGAFYQSRNVHNFNCGRNNALWVYQFSKFVQALIRDGNNPDIRFDGAKRKICRLRFRI
ncbi:hypothetical protein SDC9_159337 [bioreactor metagenome]|uniref:Uncharacterized protein n=1 Tax=bioreactor metagenome TaxID=1076179 RepID=A0A645FCM3_9ZZZZ